VGAVLAFFAGFVATAVPAITNQAQALVEQAPDYLNRLRQEQGPIHDLDQRYHVIDKIQQRIDEGPTLGLNALGGVVGVGKAVVGAVFATVTVVILVAYFLSNFPAMRRTGLRLVPRSRRARVGLITDQVFSRVGGYVLGNLATSAIAGVAAGCWLWAGGVPHAVALALFVSVFDLIPLVGATIAAILVTAIALFDSLAAGVATGIFFLVYQQIENYVLVPRIMKRTVDVSPLVTIVAALIGAALLGVVGALIAIPVAAAVQLVIGEVVYPHQDSS
jgi:predicted PurR-regulated permease PerM